MEEIIINNIKIDVIRKDIKNIHLAVYPPTGRIRIAAPMSVNNDSIRLFAISKFSWIRRQQRKFDAQERISPREYKNRESHYFQGKRYLLNIIEVNSPPQVILKNKTYIDLYIRPGTTTPKRHEIMNNWYRSELKKIIPGYIEKWEKKLDVNILGWQVRLMKTKWGSCNIKKKKILLNLELSKKPVHCLEYIIVHEMLHLFERHHNDRFQNLLETYLPMWKKLKNELNRFPINHANWSY